MLVSGTVVTGDMSSKTDIRIDGILEGNLQCDAKVVVGKNGLVQGNILCASILVEGKIDGDVLAKEKMHLMASAVITGGLATNKLIIEDGAMFSGVAMMGKPIPKLIETIKPIVELHPQKDKIIPTINEEIESVEDTESDAKPNTENPRKRGKNTPKTKYPN